jgi:hypothetical protein
MEGRKGRRQQPFFHIYMHRGFFRVGSRRPKLSAIIDASHIMRRA